jgi:hypothetical protein
MHWSQVPTWSMWFRVSQMGVPTLRGLELWQIWVNTWGSVELLNLRCWMKEWIIGTLDNLLEFLYPA